MKDKQKKRDNTPLNQLEEISLAYKEIQIVRQRQPELYKKKTLR